jgi:hypothetical protein
MSKLVAALYWNLWLLTVLVPCFSLCEKVQLPGRASHRLWGARPNILFENSALWKQIWVLHREALARI